CGPLRTVSHSRPGHGKVTRAQRKGPVMSNNLYQKPEPPDLSRFHDNWCNFPADQLVPYHGKHVAWSPDGTRILASGDTEEEVEQQLIAAGIPPSQVVGEYIPLPGTVIL